MQLCKKLDFSLLHTEFDQQIVLGGMCPKLIAGFDSDRTTTKGEQNMSQEKPQTISSKRAEDTAFETFVFGMVHFSKMK